MPAYVRLLKCIETAYPMLLSAAAPITLQRAPSAMFLLPPFNGQDKNIRYLICQFPATPGEPPGLRLFEWWPDLEWGDLPLRDFGTDSTGGKSPGPVAAYAKVDEDGLTEPPIRIHSLVNTEINTVFQLEYTNGSLTVVANRAATNTTSRINASWAPSPPASTPEERAQRITGGDMPVTLYFRRHTESASWRDDVVLNSAKQPIALSDPLIGHIAGMDGPTGSRHCYLASNLARVIRVDFSTGDVHKSDRLGGRIEDVLVIDSPTGADDGSAPAVLAACYDGKVYWLDPEDLKIVHWQPMPRLHLQRIMGTPEGQILALDQYHRLHILRLNPVSNAKSLRDRASLAILSKLEEVGLWRSYMADIRTFDTAGQRQEAKIRLLTELWLRATQSREPNSQVSQTMEDLSQVLVEEPAQDTSDTRRKAVARAHMTVMERLWTWMRNQVEGRRTDRLRDPAPLLSVLENLLYPPASSPDSLWLKMFRRHDWLEPWSQAVARETGSNPVWRRLLTVLRELVYRQRCAFASHSYALRPFLPFASLRLPGQASIRRQLLWPVGDN